MNFIATDILLLNGVTGMPAIGVFHCQGYTETDNQDFNNAANVEGDVVCESVAYNERVELSARYKFCVGGGNFGAALNLIKVGDVLNAYLITNISVSTSNSGEPEVSFTAHQHDDNAHTSESTFSIPAAVITLLDSEYSLNTAIDFFGKDAAGTIGAQSSTLTLSCEHADVQDGNGDHLAGANFNGRIEASVEYVGATSAEPDAPWIRDSLGNGRENSAAQTSSISAHQNLIRD